MKYSLVFCWLVVGIIGANAQTITLGLDQPDLLEAHAGSDTLVCKTHSVILGSNNTVTGGTGDYLYIWYPNAFLDDNTSPNPVCTAEETTTYLLTVTDASGCTATSFVTVAIDPCLGINELNNNQILSIYPNPVVDQFTISGLKANNSGLIIKILNPIGQVLYIKELSYSNGSDVVIQPDVYLQTGLYFVQIEVDGEAIRRAIQIN